LPNICGTIDGTHIPLAKRPSRGYILAMSKSKDFEIMEFISILIHTIMIMV